MGARDLLMSAAGATGKLFVDDVFSVYTYTGNGSAQTINNGIDLAGKGGLVWCKDRNSGAKGQHLVDTARGASKDLQSQSTNGQVTTSTVTGFNSNGFTLGASNDVNDAAYNFVSWTFRRAAKFFDVVTWSGNATTNRQIPHQLESAPGCVVVKCTNNAQGVENWWVWHRATPAANARLYLNDAAAASGGANTAWGTSPAFTSAYFTVGSSSATNGTGCTYVAYLFAHDASPDGIIQCGSFTTDGSGNATVTLGWEPQAVDLKASSATGNWIKVDSLRGMPVGSADAQLYSNLSNSEASASTVDPTATGFNATALAASTTYVYLAIRRPNKPPVSGADVFMPIAYSGDGTDGGVLSGYSFAPDMVFLHGRSGAANVAHPTFADRLRGFQKLLTTNNNGATNVPLNESAWAGNTGIDGNVAKVGVSAWNPSVGFQTFNSNGFVYVAEVFRRAPSFMDAVCDTGTGAAHAISHSLTVAPELVIRKSRSGTTSWEVWHSALANTEKLTLNSTAAKSTDTTAWNSTAPTASNFTVGTGANVNTNTATYVTYLFATLAGISKVGGYTGNGTSQTINCGFATGARFVLIKRTDSTGDWFVWDTARGIVAGNDPHLSLNTVAAEVTTDDSIDPDATGFIVNQVAATNINVNGATYIFLAIA